MEAIYNQSCYILKFHNTLSFVVVIRKATSFRLTSVLYFKTDYIVFYHIKKRGSQNDLLSEG